MDYYIIYETRPNKKEIFGYTKDVKIALSELRRLYNIDPFQLDRKFSLEMNQFKPMIGYELKPSKIIEVL